MQFESTLISIMLSRQHYDRFIKVLDVKALDQITAMLVRLQGTFYRENEGVNHITVEQLLTFYRLKYPNTPPETREAACNMLRLSIKPVPDDVANSFLRSVLAHAASAELTAAIDKFQSGEEIDLPAVVNDINERLQEDVGIKDDIPEVHDEIEDMLVEDENKIGFTFRPELGVNDYFRPFRGGDFGIIAARVDTGKTSFIADTTSYMAQQVPMVFPDEPDRPVVWFNNEGPGKRIKQRWLTAALGLTPDDIIAMSKLPSKQGFRSLLSEEFHRVTKGGWSRCRVLDIHDYWSHEVERIIKLLNPAIVVYDMLDVIKFSGQGNNNGQRTDQLLEAMYQWGRLQAVKYDHLGLATSQLSADAEGLRYPTLSMLKDSKTGKQGASEFMVTVGATLNPMEEYYRWIGAPKNKLSVAGKSKSPKVMVMFNPATSRFVSTDQSLESPIHEHESSESSPEQTKEILQDSGLPSPTEHADPLDSAGTSA